MTVQTGSRITEQVLKNWVWVLISYTGEQRVNGNYWKKSDKSLIFCWFMFDLCLIYVWFMSDLCLIYVWSLFDFCLIAVWIWQKHLILCNNGCTNLIMHRANINQSIWKSSARNQTKIKQKSINQTEIKQKSDINQT